MDNRGGTRRYRVPQQLIGSEKYTEMAERLINGPDHEYWLSLAKDLVLNDNRYKVSPEDPEDALAFRPGRNPDTREAGQGKPVRRQGETASTAISHDCLLW